MTLIETIANFRKGDFRRWHVFVADDNGYGPTEFIGGFDLLDEAKEAIRQIDAKADELRQSGSLSYEECDLHFWLQDTAPEADDYYFVGPAYRLA